MSNAPQSQLDKSYVPTDNEASMAKKWDNANAFHADPNNTAPNGAYSIVIPPPNVTAALHMGHALNNTIQDILTRYHRMAGFNTMWMPGTDHAGIATQSIVDKRLQAMGEPALKEYKQQELAEGTGRTAFIDKIQSWSDEYEGVITSQLKAMGCSCDWDRQRFTMDDTCAKAVREAFFQLFKDGLIYRGKRLVNWDPVSQTALSDDEVEMEDVDGNFYYMHYPVCDAQGNLTGEQVTVATTRPETMLGDTAVAVNPNDGPRAKYIGQFVKLPIVGRVIPIVGDDYVVIPDADSEDSKARMASGFLKVTPAHDPNDYLIGQRHNLPVINVMALDASISKDHGWPAEEQPEANEALQPFLGLSREDARKAIVKWFKANDLMGEVKPYRHAVGHSYRSHVPVEPYLSDQWYVKVTDERLAGAALKAMAPEQVQASEGPIWRTPGNGNDAPAEKQSWEGGLKFTPERYAKTFQTWHENIRDWCISRQLWWGHRIPVWSFRPHFTDETNPKSPEQNRIDLYFQELEQRLNKYAEKLGIENDFSLHKPDENPYSNDWHICARTEKAIWALERIAQWNFNFQAKTKEPYERIPTTRGLTESHFESRDAYQACLSVGELISKATFTQDPDVLDTWFSSALWPMSTMGWPENTELLNTFNPTSVLCTAREIITLWVSRMVMFNTYFRNELPFKDVFIHAMIQDGHGQKMSKSLGNGVDPRDIIGAQGADAMRFTLCQMTTHTQDVRMPVDMVDPFTGEGFVPEFITNKAGYKVAKPLQTRNGKTFCSSYGVATGEAQPTDAQPAAKNTSSKFDVGRNFATKLWNATRFVLSNLEEAEPDAVGVMSSVPDRWILSRTAQVIEDVEKCLAGYDFHNYANTVYQFVWNDFCDWYIESVKHVIKKPEGAHSRKVIATVLDVALRLLHPVMPFITEKLWEALNAVAPQRGVQGLDPIEHDLLATAPWPVVDRTLIDRDAEARFERWQSVVGMIREVRSKAKVPPKQAVDFTLKVESLVADELKPSVGLLEALTNTAITAMGPDVTKPEACAVITSPLGEGYLHIEVDTAEEKERLSKRLGELEKAVAQLNGRLSNKKYTEKAPSHLVQQTRDQLAEAEAELARVQEQIAAL